MKLKPFNYLREETDEYDFQGGGDGQGFEENDFSGQGEAVFSEESQQSSGGSAAGSQSIDYEALTQAIVRGVQSTHSPQSRQAPQEMTDEEFRKHTAYYQVQAAAIKELFGDEDEQVQARKAAKFQEMLDGAVTHALKVAGLMTKQNLQEVRNEYSPLIRAEEKRIYNDFVADLVKTAPILGKMRPVVDMAISQLTQSGYVSQGAQKDKQEVLKLVQQFAKATNPNFSLQISTPNGNRAGMPRMAGGVNGAGGQQSSGKRGALPKGIAIYAK